MRNFYKAAEGVSFSSITNSLFRQPELWNQNTFRSTAEGTAFNEVDDIWLRFAPDPESLAIAEDDVRNVWYPAVHKLPEIKLHVSALMQMVGAYDLHRLLVTRLKPGGQMGAHADTHGYATQPGLVRYHLVLQGGPGSLFHCGDETVNMLTGEIWTFRADLLHSVVNNSKEDRIHLLVDMSVWPIA